MKKCILVLAMCLTTAVTAFSQNDFKAFDNLGVGLKVSPFLGYGLEAATGINNKLILRLGLNLTNGIHFNEFNMDLGFDEDYILDYFGYVPVFRAKPILKFAHCNLLLDYHPGGIFHITGGVFIGASRVRVNGYLADARNKNVISKATLLEEMGGEWPSLDIGEQTITIPEGKTSLDFSLGNAIKPYLGIGVGRAVAKNKKLAFKFELGAMYQGNSFSIKQNGKLLDLSKSTEGGLRDLHDDIVEYSKYTRFFPQMNFQLSYRIF